MPGWKTHIIFSLFLVIVWMGVFYFGDFTLDITSILLIIMFIISSSLFPDIDMKKSKVRDVFALLVSAAVSGMYLVFFIESWYYAFAYFVILYFILRYIPTKHRGITHTFKFSILFSLTLTSAYFVFKPFIFEQFAIWFVIVFSGYALHLVIDKT